MLDKIIGKNNSYQLSLFPSLKQLALIDIKQKQVVLTAKFFCDDSDGSALLSDFQYVYKNNANESLVLMTANLISDYLAVSQNKCKLFCYPGIYQTEFTNDANYRCTNLDRLMLREKPITPSNIICSALIYTEILHSEKITQADLRCITSLLKQTYWAKDVDEPYIRKAINNSFFLVGRDRDDNIIGLVRYITNEHFAYISDMVVDEGFRRQNIATHLLQLLCSKIDKTNLAFTALISAKEGDGKDAALSLYNNKFGFVNYNQSHENEIFFRYITKANNLENNNSKVVTDPFGDDMPAEIGLQIFKFLDEQSVWNARKVSKKFRFFAEKTLDGYQQLKQLAGDDFHYTWKIVRGDNRPWKKIYQEENAKLNQLGNELHNFLTAQIDQTATYQQDECAYLEMRAGEFSLLFEQAITNEALIKRYIERGFDVNAIDSTGRPLAYHIIYTLGDRAQKPLEIMLKAGLNVNSGFAEISNLLLFVTWCTAHIDEDIVQLLIDFGVDVNARLNDDVAENACENALYYAMADLNVCVVKKLLAAGADPNVYCTTEFIDDELEQLSPLQAIIRKWNSDFITKYPLQQADIVFNSKYQDLPNEFEFRENVDNFKEIIQLLIEYGADTSDIPWLNDDLEEHKDKRQRLS